VNISVLLDARFRLIALSSMVFANMAAFFPQLVYDDGDQEHVDWPELQWLLSTAQSREEKREAACAKRAAKKEGQKQG
jgi:hypothetical protein